MKKIICLLAAVVLLWDAYKIYNQDLELRAKAKTIQSLEDSIQDLRIQIDNWEKVGKAYREHLKSCSFIDVYSIKYQQGNKIILYSDCEYRDLPLNP